MWRANGGGGGQSPPSIRPPFDPAALKIAKTFRRGRSGLVRPSPCGAFRRQNPNYNVSYRGAVDGEAAGKEATGGIGEKGM